MIATYQRRHRARFLSELQQLVRFPSVSAQPKHRADLLACATWVAKHFRQLGLKVTTHPTAGHPIIEARTAPQPGQPTVLIYGHYDVQPPEPFDLWKTPPFEPVIRAGKMFGRGASDNKGQFFAHVKAVESHLATAGKLPVNVVFLIEGEEEVGSEALMKFCRQHARRLRADYLIISDTGMYAKALPTLTYATRGLVAIEIRVDGPGRDLHSGVFGGSVANPVMTLAKLLATCVDAKGHVTVPGYYDDVKPLAAWERRAWRKLPVNDRQYAASLGAPAVTGEAGYTTLERRWARPTIEINGITGGYQGPGSKTIVPAWASAKITCRLVPNQSAKEIQQLVIRHLRRHCPPTVRLTIEAGHCAPPFLTPPTGRGARAALAALETAFGRTPVCVREGGTLPILDVFKKHLGGEIVLVGLGLPDDNWHSPNEKMELNNFYRGIAMSAELLRPGSANLNKSMVYVIAGVSGSGKTVVGAAVAARLAVPFYDGDDFHPAGNIAKMSAGIPLDDADRAPWLATLAGQIREWNATGGAVLACSALKEKYRVQLRTGEAVTFVFLELPKAELAARLRQRPNHFMPVALLDSQLAALEIPAEAIRVDATGAVTTVVQRVLTALTQNRATV